MRDREKVLIILSFIMLCMLGITAVLEPILDRPAYINEGE